MTIDVEKGQLLEPSRVGAVDEKARAHSRLDMARGEIVTVEVEQAHRRTAPSDAVGETMDQAVVDGEHEWRVDGVRRFDRAGLRSPDIPCLLSSHGGSV